jgi:integrase
MRHHFATTLLRSGLSPVAVGHLLGHADGALVLRTYGHWMPDDDSLARRALDAAWTLDPADTTAETARLAAVR